MESISHQANYLENELSQNYKQHHSPGRDLENTSGSPLPGPYECGESSSLCFHTVFFLDMTYTQIKDWGYCLEPPRWTKVAHNYQVNGPFLPMLSLSRPLTLSIPPREPQSSFSGISTTARRGVSFWAECKEVRSSWSVALNIHHDVRKGGETKITPSPRTNRYGTCLFEVCKGTRRGKKTVSLLMHHVNTENTPQCRE